MTHSEESWWVDHLNEIERLGIGTKQYADEHGLSVSQLYAWRQRLKRRARRQGSAFVAVSVSEHSPTRTSSDVAATTVEGPAGGGVCQVSLPSGISLWLSDTPDAQWLLELSAGLERQAGGRL